jgi:hypothetical protein
MSSIAYYGTMAWPRVCWCCKSWMALSALFMMCTLTFIVQLVICHTALIVSINCSLMLQVCMRLYKGVGWHLTSQLAAFVTGWCSRCVRGSVTKHSTAHCWILSTSRWKGSRSAITSKTSVAVVFIKPMIMITAHHWIIASLLMIAWPDFPFFGFAFVLCCSVCKMSAVYGMQRYCNGKIELVDVSHCYSLWCTG